MAYMCLGSTTLVRGLRNGPVLMLRSRNTKASLRLLTIMATVPRTTNTVTLFPDLLGLRDRNYIANELVARHDREAVPEHAVLNNRIGMTYPDSEDFDEDLRQMSSA